MSLNGRAASSPREQPPRPESRPLRDLLALGASVAAPKHDRSASAPTPLTAEVGERRRESLFTKPVNEKDVADDLVTCIQGARGDNRYMLCLQDAIRSLRALNDDPSHKKPRVD